MADGEPIPTDVDSNSRQDKTRQDKTRQEGWIKGLIKRGGALLRKRDQQPETKATPRITKLDIENGKVVTASAASIAVRESILAHSEQLKKRALEIFPDHDGGEEVARIDAFFEREGLKTKPAKILTPEELIEYRAELAKIGYSHFRLDEIGKITDTGSILNGLYIPELELIVAVRPLHSGSIELQRLMAHEKAHSTTEYDDMTTYADDKETIHYNIARVGQVLMRAREGAFLEEGFAEYMAARFLRNELKLPNGIWGNEQYKSLGGITLPSIYAWPGVPQSENADSPRSYTSLSNSDGSYGAYGLDLIAQKYPEINHALINARKSVEGLREVVQIIERVRPGLYSEIRKLKNPPEDFKKGLQSIQVALAT